MDCAPTIRTFTPTAPVIKRLRLEKGWVWKKFGQACECSVKKRSRMSSAGANVYYYTRPKLAKKLASSMWHWSAEGKPLAESLAVERPFEVQIQLSVPYHDFDQTAD